jgi:hypothetical protein
MQHGNTAIDEHMKMWHGVSFRRRIGKEIEKS